MKIKRVIYSALAAAGMTFCTTACSDYLDVASELNENLTLDKVWSNPNYTRNWYGTIYQCMSEFSETGSEASAFKNPWSNMCGEISSQMSPGKDAMTAGYTANTAGFHRWGTLYQYIRESLIFLRDARDQGVGADSNKLTAEEIARMKDEVRFLMAYSYFSIFEMYGPAPIVTTIDDPAYPKITDYKRPTVDRMVEFTDSLLVDVLNRDHLPQSIITSASNGTYAYNLNEVVRPTRITVMALRAKLWVYAASKLFNGGWNKAMELKTADGEQIFPAYNRDKWVKAKECLEDLLAACATAGHSLYTVNVNGSNQPDRAVYQLFQEYNQEILWCNTNNSYSDQYKMEKRTNPRDVNSCYGSVGPTQEAVDMFFTKNGLTIAEDENYTENKMMSVRNPTYNENAGRDDANIFSMYANREPRFYANVMYQGKSWFNKKFNDGHPNYFIDFSLKGGAGPGSKDTPLTGYMLAKFKNRTVNHASNDIQIFRRVSIIYRLAEFYLFYAEVLNELNPADERIVEHIDYVRHRAGIPTYEKLAEDGKKSIGGDYDKQFEAIQRERFVELYCEGQRYFDIRRWMICGTGQTADQTRFSGMNEYGTTDVAIGQMGSYYNRTVLENRIWNERMYLYPIHYDVIALGQGRIPQNPGW